jgi:hypothetical protein
VKLSGQKVTVLLSEDGKAVLALAAIDSSGTSSISVSVEEAEELGLWIRVPREDQMHLFLLLWGYIVGIEIPTGGGKLVGMR